MSHRDLDHLLSDDDWDTLYRAKSLADRFESGIFPSAIGDVSHFRKLERMGLLVFEGWGRDIDGIVERDVTVYRLTPIAVQILSTRDAYISALAQLLTKSRPTSQASTLTAERS